MELETAHEVQEEQHSAGFTWIRFTPVFRGVQVARDAQSLSSERACLPFTGTSDLHSLFISLLCVKAVLVVSLVGGSVVYLTYGSGPLKHPLASLAIKGI